MKRVLQSIGMAIFICILLIFLKNNYSFMLIKNANYGMPALIEKGEINNLFIGSSMFRQGLDIEVLESNFEDNYILAYNGNQPYLEYFQLKNLIENGVQINHLFIDMYAYSLWANPKISDEKMLLEFNLNQKEQLVEEIKNDKLAENVKLIWQTYISSNNELIVTWPISGMMINRIFRKGGSVSTPMGSDKRALDTMEVNTLFGEMNPIQEEYLMQLINLAKEHNIEIYFVETPKYIKTMNDKGYQLSMEKYRELLREVSIPFFSNEQGNENNKYSFDNEDNKYFVDTVHLSYEGRVAYTRLLCEWINLFCKREEPYGN